MQVQATFYVIRGVIERDVETDVPLYWSNVDGWVNGEDATRFTPEEHSTLALPIGGEWERWGEKP